jgi:hypothetical protein
MRKLKSSNGYLKSQTRNNFAKAALSIAIFILIFALASYRAIVTLSVGLLEIAGFAASLIPLAAFLFYQRKYNIYRGGRQGEQDVVGTLSRSLNDDFSLINGVCIGGGGDIDHIVLGPGGVFVLETKNWSGKININGDQWQRPGKQAMGSPSLQAKRNTQKVKRLLDQSSALRSIWVEGIVVLTNKHASLNVNNPTVTILKLPQLASHIKGRPINHLTEQQIQQIAKQIQNA